MQFDFSNPTWIIVMAVAVVAIVIGIAASMQIRKKRTERLRQRFGTEYELAVAEEGSKHKAEVKLADRQASVEKLKLRELGQAQRDRFMLDWTAVQSRFLDHPKGALTEADELVSALLQARGYPVQTFEQGAEVVSVDHPRMIEDYRAAHAVAKRAGRGEASTEELRTAMIQYRTLFDELVQVEMAAARA
jgi:hypothetical protein